MQNVLYISYLMDMSSQDKLKYSFLESAANSTTLFLTILSAAKENPGDPSTLFLYFDKVDRHGRQFLTVVLRKLYACQEYPARVMQKIISLLL
jgi:hypothetical protein